MTKFQHFYGVKLNDGSEHWFVAKRVPAHWKSWVMQQMPYMTDFLECQFMQRAAQVCDATTGLEG